MKKYFALFLSVVFFVNIMGCALTEINPANLKGNHARARFVNVTYTMAFADYQRYATLPNLRPEAIELLKAKRMLLVNLHLPISLLNNHAETGVVTDAMFNSLLEKLLDLEMGWYTNPQELQTFSVGPNVKDEHIRKAVAEAGLVDETTAYVDPLFMGVLLELLRAGIHAVRAMLSQRNLDEVQMKAAWEESWNSFKLLNPNALTVLE